MAKLPGMAIETFTIRDAAKRCGVTYQAMRKRVDRESVRTVKRDGVRLIPRGELERAGLWPGSTASDHELRAENERLRCELETHRTLTERAQGAGAAERQARELAEQAAIKERAEREAAEQQAVELRDRQHRLAQAGWRERRQLLRDLRTAA